MPDHRRRKCKECKGHYDDIGPLSWRGLCSVCGPKRSEDNGRALHAMQGEPVLRWRKGMAASVGAILLDDLPPNP